MKKYVVDLTDLGVKRKVVLFKGESRDLIHGQPTSNLDVVYSYPQYFKEIISEEAPVVNTVVESVVEEVIESQVEVVETVVEDEIEEVVETVVEDEIEEVVETVVEDEVEEVVETPETIEEVLKQAGEFKTKAELEEFGLKYGINLNRQNSMKNMIKELEAHLTK